jgi:hypothetical protein
MPSTLRMNCGNVAVLVGVALAWACALALSNVGAIPTITAANAKAVRRNPRAKKSLG